MCIRDSCKTKLPGKAYNMMQRWKLRKEDKATPVLFISNGVQVAQIEPQYFKSEYDLVRELRLLSMRRPYMAKNTELLREKCWGKPRCLLIMQGGSLEGHVEKALHAVAGHHSQGGKGRKGASAEDKSAVAFVAMDAQEHKLPFEGFELGDDLKLRRFEAGSHRAIYFRNVSGAWNPVGNAGVALVTGKEAAAPCQLVLYEPANKRPFSVTSLAPSASFTVNAPQYVALDDDQGNAWSLYFAGADDAAVLLQHATLARAAAAAAAGDAAVVTQDVAPVSYTHLTLPTKA